MGGLSQDNDTGPSSVAAVCTSLHPLQSTSMYGRHASLEIGIATEKEIQQLADEMAVTQPYLSADFSAEKLQRLLVSAGTVYAARATTRHDADEKFLIGGFVFSEQGCMDRPALRYPLALNGLPETLTEIIRNGAQCVAQSLKGEPHVYVTIPGHQKGVIRALFETVPDLPRFDPIITITDYYVQGNSEEILRWTRKPPRSPAVDAQYGRSDADITKYPITGGLGIMNIAAESVDPDLLTNCALQMSAVDPWRYYGYSVEDCEAKLSAKGAHLLVAHHQGNGKTPVGFLLFHPKGLIGLPEMCYICVFKHYRGQGVGKALIEEAMRLVLENPSEIDGCPPRVFLTVSEPNPARHVYEHLGFRRIGGEQGHNTAEEEEIAMAKTIDPSALGA